MTTGRLFPCGWMMFCKYLEGLETKQMLYGEGWEDPLPQDLGVVGEMWRTEDKRSSLYYNISLKGYLYSPTQTLCRLLCYCCLILEKKKFFTIVFLLLWFLGFWSLFLFGWGFFFVVFFFKFFLSWKKEMELGRYKESLLGILLCY